MKSFRKLIRDRIPEIIAAKGERSVTRVLDDAEFLPALENKLLEEVQEMRLGVNRQEEIADIYEVLDALIAAYGFLRRKSNVSKIKSAPSAGDSISDYFWNP